jgi:hypothetical protein
MLISSTTSSIYKKNYENILQHIRKGIKERRRKQESKELMLSNQDVYAMSRCHFRLYNKH